MPSALERHPWKPHRDRLAAAVCGVAVIAGGGLLTSGCTSEQPSTTSAPTTAPAASLGYAEPGPHAVGYRVFTTHGSQHHALTLRAWYPADPPAGAQDATITYSAPNKFDESITPGKGITAAGAALLGARPERTADPYPLVVFSHGYALSPIVYSALVEHWASQGFVVLAPEHNETFDQSLTGFWKALVDRPDDIHRTIDFAEDLNDPGAPFAGLLDLDEIAVVGHSYGGYTALAAGGARFDFAAYQRRCAALKADDPLNFFCAPVLPRESAMATRAGLPAVPSGLWPSLGDTRVKAVISMAGDAYPFDRRGLEELTVPVMALGGTVDDGTPYTWGTGLTYDNAGSEDKSLITFPGAGHMIFLDPCEDIPWVRGSDYRDGFCKDAVWKTRPLDIVEHYTTAFLRETLSADADAKAALAGPQPQLDDVEYATTRRP
ncbi:MAG: alpha/beta fold hydrolase [Nocardioidaceae bacterium]|nr:alpha/beta fold hydrolase [Nocardioidaceae bacterium]